MKIGDTYSLSTIVDNNNIASTVRSGLLPVFATPAMIALMENASSDYLNQFLENGESSVGIHIEVDHLKATPIGMTIVATIKVIDISSDGKQITFEVEAHDNKELIGKGIHKRAIIQIDRFMQRVESKK